MKSGFCLLHLVFVTVSGMLLTGCLFKPVTISTRHFVLAPIPSNEPPVAVTGHISVGIGYVKMPSYLLRSSIAVRNGENEIQYIENALWAERLDQSFQRTLAENLSRLLPSDHIYLGDWGREQAQARAFITVQQFDVDTRGHGALVANWRITRPDKDTPVKNGHSRLVQAGASPGASPEIIAATLSSLTAEFSRELAESIRESVNSSP